MKFYEKVHSQLGYPKKEKGFHDLCGVNFCKQHLIEMNFKWEKKISPTYNNSCDCGEFSHSYIIVYEYFSL